MADDPGVEVIVEAPDWNRIGIGALAQRAIAATLADAGLAERPAEIAVLACDDARIAALNGQFRDRSAATNVLAFPAQELGPAVAGRAPRAPRGAELGDIAIAWQTCAREASIRWRGPAPTEPVRVEDVAIPRAEIVSVPCDIIHCRSFWRPSAAAG
jgi:probable rRNA maturation factor